MPFRFNPFTNNLDIIDITAIPPGTVATITGNSGGAVGPDGSNNLNLIGTAPINIVGNPGTNTLAVSISGSSYISSITATSPITANGVSGSPQTGAVTLAISGSGFVSSITGTANQIAVSASTGAITLSFTNGISIGSYQSTTPPSGGILVPGKVLIGTTSAFDANTVVQINRSGAFTYLDITGDVAQQQAIRLTDSVTSIILYKLQSTTAFRIYNSADVAGFHTNGSVSIGNTNAGTAAADNGLQVQGLTYLGATGASVVTTTVRASLFMNTGDGCALSITGTANSILSTGKMTALDIVPNMVPTGGIAGNVLAGISLHPVVSAPSATTISTVHMMNITPSLSTNVGTISEYDGIYIYNFSATGTVTLARGLGIEAPTFGVSNICAAFGGGICIGSSYFSTVPPTNGAIIQGQVGIGTSSASNLLTLGAVNTSLSEAIRVNGTVAAQTYMSFYGNTTRQGYLGTAGGSGGIVLNSDVSSLIIQTAGLPTYFTGQTVVGINGGLSVGASYYSTIPPSSGAIIQGQVGLGVSSLASNVRLEVFAATTDVAEIYIHGTLNAISGANSSWGILCQPILQPTNGTAAYVTGIECSPTIIAPSAKTIAFGLGAYINPIWSSNVGTITTAANLYIDTGSTSAGTVTNMYGLYVRTPATGPSLRRCAFFESAVVYNQSTTGAGTALLGANSPAVTNTAPYTWLTFVSSDMSVVYVPAWK
jgi:hypothetical protein